MHFLLPSLIALMLANAVVAGLMFVLSNVPAAKLAMLTSVLYWVTLAFTNWGVSSPEPTVDVFWGGLVMAAISQVACIITVFRRRSLDKSQKRKRSWPP